MFCLNISIVLFTIMKLMINISAREKKRTREWIRRFMYVEALYLKVRTQAFQVKTPRVSCTFWKQSCPSFHHGKVTHSHPFCQHLFTSSRNESLQQICFLRVSSYADDLISVYLICISKAGGKMKRRGRPRVKGFCISIISEEKGLFVWIRTILIYCG